MRICFIWGGGGLNYPVWVSGREGTKGAIEMLKQLKRTSERLKKISKNLICLLKPKVEVICEQFRRAAKINGVRLFTKIKY